MRENIDLDRAQALGSVALWKRIVHAPPFVGL